MKVISMQIEMTSYIYFCTEDEINFAHFVKLCFSFNLDV